MSLPKIKLDTNAKILVATAIVIVVILTFMLPGLIATRHEMHMIELKRWSIACDFWRSLFHL